LPLCVGERAAGELDAEAAIFDHAPQHEAIGSPGVAENIGDVVEQALWETPSHDPKSSAFEAQAEQLSSPPKTHAHESEDEAEEQ